MAEIKHHDATRPGEIEAPLPEHTDARVVFIGTIRTPFRTRDDCPRQGKAEGPLCRIELHDPWKPALKGIERFGRIEVLYWMHQARRDLILQSPKANGETFGTFALRSPVRPNPIATSMVELVAVEDGVLVVRGLDCVDGTPLVDLKPDRCAYTPLAPPNPGELTEASS
jgi:tRNA-Thr(GGU) m(6)t(6)A37 methyltransferase TsaA